MASSVGVEANREDVGCQKWQVEGGSKEMTPQGLLPLHFQSPALKTQGKLNTRPGKVGRWGQVCGGKCAAGGGGLGLEPKDALCAFSS